MKFNDLKISPETILLDKYRVFRESENLGMWKVGMRENGSISILTPNRATLEFNDEIDWFIEPSDQYQSTLMWLYSLGWLRPLVKENVDATRLQEVLNSYVEFIESDRGQERLATLTSRDHMVAEALKSLSYLVTLPNFRVQGLVRGVTTLLHWAVSPGNIASNNHGMMLASAVMHACHVFNFEGSDELATTMSQKILEVIRAAFDSTWLCVENSPSYHSFYIRYIRGLLAEAKEIFKIEEQYSSDLRDIETKALDTLEKTALPNGQLPPLGDGNLVNVPEILEVTSDSELFSKDSGFYCTRRGGTYFSMKSGLSSIVHKHSDENSIFLFTNGVPAVLDAGLYNYDWKNSYTCAVKSQRGHSGPYWTKFDPLYPATLFRHDNLRVLSNLTMNKVNSQTLLKGQAVTDDIYKVTREVFFETLDDIRIVDSFEGSDEDRVVRFLVNGEAMAKISETSAEFHHPNFILTIDFSKSSKSQLLRGKFTADRVEGWQATGFGEITEAWCLELGFEQEEFTKETRLRLKARDNMEFHEEVEIPQSSNRNDHERQQVSKDQLISLDERVQRLERFTEGTQELGNERDLLQKLLPHIQSILTECKPNDTPPPVSPTSTPHGWDSLVDPWANLVPTIGDKIPSAYRIWKSSRRYFLAGDRVRADLCERLNYLLHNSYIPAKLDLRGEVTFAYGGIGVIIHHDADIFEYVTVGANSTIGGNGGQTRIDPRSGQPTSVPQIGSLSVLGASTNVTGGIALGAMTIVAPNAVVTKSTAPGTILAGVPARSIGKVDMNNAARYKSKYLPARAWSMEEYMTKAEILLTEGESVSERA